MDIYETQWKMIGENIESGKIIICEAVFNEIKKSVELKQWLEKYKKLIEPCYSDKVLIEAKYSVGSKKTRIPFICKEMSIKCINTHEFYKNEGWKF